MLDVLPQEWQVEWEMIAIAFLCSSKKSLFIDRPTEEPSYGVRRLRTIVPTYKVKEEIRCMLMKSYSCPCVKVTFHMVGRSGDPAIVGSYVRLKHRFLSVPLKRNPMKIRLLLPLDMITFTSGFSSFSFSIIQLFSNTYSWRLQQSSAPSSAWRLEGSAE